MWNIHKLKSPDSGSVLSPGNIVCCLDVNILCALTLRATELRVINQLILNVMEWYQLQTIE